MTNDNIEAIYPLSLIQQGLLFHSRYEGGPSIYIEQMTCMLQGPLRIEVFQRALQAVVDCHPILRTSFVWEGLRQPMQVVHERVKLPFRHEDWRDLGPITQADSLDRYIEKDRAEGFDFSRAPLMRVSLLQTGEDDYRLVWSNHHILFDGWCRELIIQEVFIRYEAYSQSDEPRLKARRPFRDYVLWLNRQDHKDAEEYWRAELKNFSPPPPLGTERPASKKSGGRFSEQFLSVSRETTKGLSELGRRLQVTLSILVQAAWAVVLSRYSRCQDVVFGVTVSGRSAPLLGIEGMLGLFVNILPLRIDIRDDESFESFLRRLQAKQSRLLEYEYVPLARVRSWSEIPHGLPLFESAFAFQNYPIDMALRDRSESGIMGSEVRHFTETNYALTIRATPGAELLLNALYDCSRFEHAAMNRLLGHIRRVIEAMVEREGQRPLRDLSLLSKEEARELITDWNRTACEYPIEKRIHELFEQQVKQSPDRVALAHEDTQMSYRELDRRANQLARYLTKLGVEAEVLVGIYLERRIEMIIGILGVLKAGGAYLPLDPSYPSERLGYMIDKSQAPIVLTQRGLAETLPVSWVQLITIEDDWETIAGESDAACCATAASDNLAYVIFTSGSTGRPKGVGIEHRGLCNLSGVHENTLRIRPGAPVLQFASLSFDAATWEWVMALTCGGKLVLISREETQSPGRLLELIEKHGIETVTLPPSVAVAVLGIEQSPLRTLVVAGEACPTELINRNAAYRLINAYGPTETTVCATMSGELKPGDSPTIGRPIANTQVFILDERLNPVPVGIAGQLFIGGDAVARCYLNQPDLTAERFAPDSFTGRPGGRVYKTGDLCWYREDGNIEFAGRIDHQVKIRGFRIEPGEIESTLGCFPGIELAIVVVREEEPGDRRLVAYFSANEIVNISEVRRYLKERLPDYMAPSSFVQVEHWPYTPNGKIDRQALIRLKPGIESREYVAPRNEIEEKLCGLWSELLKTERIGIEDNFFELGGHSLLATQLISRIQTDFGVSIPMHALFSAPTVSDVGAYIAAASVAETAQSSITRDSEWGQLLNDIEGMSESEAEAMLGLERIENEPILRL